MHAYRNAYEKRQFNSRDVTGALAFKSLSLTMCGGEFGLLEQARFVLAQNLQREKCPTGVTIKSLRNTIHFNGQTPAKHVISPTKPVTMRQTTF